MTLLYNVHDDHGDHGYLDDHDDYLDHDDHHDPEGHRSYDDIGYHDTLGQHWLLKQFSLNHPVEHIQKPKLPKLYVRVETSTSYFIIHNQFVK